MAYKVNEYISNYNFKTDIMRFESTRGHEKGLSFEDVLFSGFANNGGMYMPETVPVVSSKEFHEWANFTYDQLVFQILRKFISITEISDEDLKGVLSSSFKRFRHPSVIGVKALTTKLSIFEFFYGPTLAFKDLAMSVVAGLLNYFTERKKKHLIGLVATSGDTGSSALESVRGRQNMDIIVLLPKHRCSKIQRLQMTTIADDNTHVYSVNATSDELDAPIKRFFQDREFALKHNLLSMNSVNMCRILAQIPMHVFTYYRLASRLGEPVEIILPTGGAGNITAGCLASAMGYPIRLICAVNINDVFAKTLQDGIVSISEQVHKTFSNAMDIQVPYNMERIFYLFSGRQSDKIRALMEAVERNGKGKVPEEIMIPMRRVITDYHIATDDEVINVMRRTKSDYDYVICPHTAVGVSYCLHHQNETDFPRAVFATASPEKFPEAVTAAGIDPTNDNVRHLFDKEETVTELSREDDLFAILKSKIVAITETK